MKIAEKVKWNTMTAAGAVASKGNTKLLKASRKKYTHLEIIKEITELETTIAKLEEVTGETYAFTPKQIKRFERMKTELEQQVRLWRHKMIKRRA